MYHGVDFWKIVAWVKDELASRLNSFVCRWDSSSKTVRLMGRGVFQLALRSRRVPVSIDISDVAFFLAARR